MSNSLPQVEPVELERAWRALDRAVSAARPFAIFDMLAAGGDARLNALTLSAAGIQVDLTRQRLPDSMLSSLADLARAARVEGLRSAMMSGAWVNISESRAALHTALRARAGDPTAASDPAIARQVADNLLRMRQVADAVRAGGWRGSSGRPISDVLHVGIGGSQLGPQLACEALAEFGHRRVRIHFLGNIDPDAWTRIRTELNPATTLVIIASKSWRTPETARNGQAVRDWLLGSGMSEPDLSRHVLGVTANRDAARAFGIADELIFDCPDWVGGRYSLWGAIGLPLMISIGADAFERMLAGARQMDEHFLHAPILRNAPLMLALTSAWNACLLARASEVVIPYSDRLRRLPAHLQQLQMESNGKSVLASGTTHAARAAMPAIWGEPGTESQHSFFQALHQGPIEHAIEFVLVAGGHASPDPWCRDRALLANALAQARALTIGHPDQRLERQHAGNRPVSLITLDSLDPASFGALIALYEHKTASLGWLWGINPFDQWGVELGKRLAERIEGLVGPQAEHRPDDLDPATWASLQALTRS